MNVITIKNFSDLLEFDNDKRNRNYRLFLKLQIGFNHSLKAGVYINEQLLEDRLRSTFALYQLPGRNKINFFLYLSLLYNMKKFTVDFSKTALTFNTSSAGTYYKDKSFLCLLTRMGSVLGVDLRGRRGIGFISSDDINVSYHVAKFLSNIFIFKQAVFLHSPCLSKQGIIFLFPGCSGSGKTTIANCLLKSGFQLLSDDSCCLYSFKGTIYADLLPGIASIDDYNHSPISRFNYAHTGSLGVRYIIFLESDYGRETKLVPLPAPESLRRLILLSDAGRYNHKEGKNRQINLLTELIKQSSCYLLQKKKGLKDFYSQLRDIIDSLLKRVNLDG